MRLPNNYFAKFEGQQRVALDGFSQDVQTKLLAGRPVMGSNQNARGANLRWFPLTATTPATPDEEFSIVHNIGSIPYNLIPCLPLDTAGAMLVDLTVTRAADIQRVYLSSSVADAPITVFVEAPIS